MSPLLPRAFTELKALLSIGIPILISQLAQMGMAVTDVIMAGNLSANDLAAVSIGASLWIPVMLLTAGILLITSSMISNHHGARNAEKIVETGQQGLWMGVWLGGLACLYLLNIHPILKYLQISPLVEAKTIGYLQGIAISAPVIGVHFALRNYCEALTHTRPVMAITLVGMIFNIPMNMLFMNGYVGIPAMGGAGCGWATSVVNWALIFLLIAHTRKDPRYQSYFLYGRLARPKWQIQQLIIRLGLPIGIAIFFETSLFSALSLLVAKFGSVILSSHEIAHNISTIIFMIPLSLGMAITVRSSFLLGEQKFTEARLSAFTGMSLALFLALLSFSFTLTFRLEVAGLYTSNQSVLSFAAYILLFTAFFQFSDAIQVCSAGALRAYKDTTYTMATTFLAYWVIGLPSGYLFAETSLLTPALGAPGYWLGVTAGLTCAAVLLSVRLWKLSGKYGTIVKNTDETF